MRKFSLMRISLIFIFMGFLSNHIYLQTRFHNTISDPEPLDPEIQIKHFLNVEDNCIRIDEDPTSGYLYYMRRNGEIYQVDLENPGNPILVNDSDDHGIGSNGTTADGFAIAGDGTFFIVGNNDVNLPTNIGIIKKGELVGETRFWSTVAQTESYPHNKTFNHNFNAIAVSPDGNYLFVNSGARTDHGEDQRNDGLREFPITSLLLRLPIDGEDITLYNDEDSLRNNGYFYADGLRNIFDLAFAPNGDLFGPENSGDRDDPEELNWIREGRHYGFPWRIGTNDTPQQFAGYDPNNDPLIPSICWACDNGFFHDDPSYPPTPDSIVFTDPVKSVGPDADKFRDPEDGTIKDASDLGEIISTFTPHRSPLGLVFDSDSLLSDVFVGGGFVLSNSSLVSSTLGDPGEDLLHLNLFKEEGENVHYEAEVTRIAKGFSSPVDAVMAGSKIYVIEYAFSGSSNIWEVTLPGKSTSVDDEDNAFKSFSLLQNYPNPFNPITTIHYNLNQQSKIVLKIFNTMGQEIKTLVNNEEQAAGAKTALWDGTDNFGQNVGSGIYFYTLIKGHERLSRKMLLLR